MTQTAREYLAARFRDDARALRDRAGALASGTRVPGPDAATSNRMAAACEEVAEMVSAISDAGGVDDALAALAALIPLLEQRAATQSATPVRAVYAGAATRIREVRDAEARAAVASADGPDDDALDDALDDDVDDDDMDDDPLPNDPT